MAPDNPEETSEKVVDGKGRESSTDQDGGGSAFKGASSEKEPNEAVTISDSEDGDEDPSKDPSNNNDKSIEDDDDDVITITANDGSLGRGHLIAPPTHVPEENDVELLDDDDDVQEIANQDEDDLLAEVDEEGESSQNKIIYNELDSSLSSDTGKLADGTADDEDDVLLLSDGEESKSSMGNSGLSRNQQAMFAKSGLIIESVRSGAADNNSRNNNRGVVEDDDDVMEIDDQEEDMYEGSENDISQDGEVQMLRRNNNGGVGLMNGGDSNDSNNSDVKEIDETSTIVVNDTKSLAELANSKQETGSNNSAKEPTLVIIDTNSILTGKGPVPISNKHNNNHSRGQVDSNNSLIRATPALKGSASASAKDSIDIPDDAFLIEAPSFIVPYVFEQSGEKSMKEKIKEVHDLAKADKEEKVAKGEALTAEDQIYEPKKPSSDDYFESPVGKLLMNIGVNLVQEFVQVDLLKFQKRQGEKEKKNSRMGMMTHMTQQSIISLKKNIDETKENNEPFKSKMKKCELCNFKTESELVMSTHLETPHMRNYSYRCNFCTYTTRVPQEIIFHMEAEHTVKARLERAPAYHQCPNCHFEDNSKAKLNRHLLGCTKRFNIEKNMEPPLDWDTPAKLPKLPKNRALPHGINPAFLAPPSTGGVRMNSYPGLQQGRGGVPNVKGNLPPLLQAPKNKPIPGLIRTTNPRALPNQMMNPHLSRGMMMKQMPGQIQQAHLQLGSNQMLQQVVSGQLLGIGQGAATSFLNKLGLQPGQATGSNASLQKSASPQFARGNANKSNQPSISITPLPRQQAANAAAASQQKPSGKTSFVICEICDGYIKDLDQLRNHMQWIHKVKIHPKMIYNKPPLNCQKCQFRFFTDQGLERHLLGSHGLVTSSMQDAANKGQDSGRCPLCGKVYQWKLLAHVAKDHNVTLKPAHLSYKCTVCTATFGMYKLFESHVYSAHSVTKNATPRNDIRRPANQPSSQGMPNRNQLQVTPRPMPTSTSSANFKPLKINDEITIIPQPMANAAQRSKGSLTITPQPAPRRNVRSNEDDGIQIIEIDDAAPKISSNGRGQNGDFKGRFPMSETLRKRNLEISLCGTDSDNSDDSRGPGPKRIRQN